MNLQNLRIAAKLWLVVGLFIAALLALIGFAALRSAASQADADRVLGQAELKIHLAGEWSGLTDATVSRVIAAAISSDETVTVAFKEQNEKSIAQISELQKQLKELATSDAERAQMDKIGDLRKKALAHNANIVALRKDGKGDAARELATGPFRADAAVYLQALREFVVMQKELSRQGRERVAAERRQTVVVAAVAVALIIAGMVAGTLALVGSIRNPVREAVGLADRIAAGDLSAPRTAHRGDEFGELMTALGRMAASLSGTIVQVRQASDSIRTASAEIAAGNQDLSQRTEQTASSLQQTASSIEQLTGTVRQSADSAAQANQLAASAQSVAQRGGEVVSQVVSTMDEINTASKRIADIIGTIDGIAFQTNILALNAAVEAARAGEQGRGFAVVAGEVRSLAQRSAEAAREIKSLISASVEKVESGSRLVQDAGSTMNEIVSSVSRVTDIIGEISAASAEQSSGIGLVNGAVTDLDQMTQQNAALVEQSAAAAESLKSQADRLASMVATFRADGAAAPAMPPAASPVRAPAAAPVLHSAPAARPAPALQAPKAAAPRPAPAPVAAPRPAPAPAASSTADADWETF
ncbi:methyl-accepting chemotaxis protein [Ideonella sp. DXS22W]|uniref:Methyl-accepting chemotaxis protein n=1 Tax=Pseudaquabacterium inlustre TaxID=2984192 RepID=A0ABU9CDJ2_9BURK